MANEPQRGATTEAPPIPAPADAEKREEWFVVTPDPWKEVAALEHGGDRTFATTIERMVLRADAGQQPGLEKKLLGVLGQNHLTPAGRSFACRMLGLIGSTAGVAALTPLLNENETADAARTALDGVADETVNSAYRAALGRLSGAAKAGIIGSIALRGDRRTLDALRATAADAGESADVRVAATRAVERLAATS